MLYCKLFNIIFADRGPHAFWLHVYQFVMSSNTFNAANKLPTVLSIINIAPIRENYPFSYYHNPYMINYFGDHNYQADPDFSNQDVLTNMLQTFIETWKIKMALFPSKLGASHVSKPQRNLWSRILLYQYLHYEYVQYV